MAIKIQGLTKKYRDKTVVDALCLEVRQGELFALLGGVFYAIAKGLPFMHAVELSRGGLQGVFLIESLLMVISYTLVVGIVAVLLFLRQMKKR